MFSLLLVRRVWKGAGNMVQIVQTRAHTSAGWGPLPYRCCSQEAENVFKGMWQECGLQRALSSDYSPTCLASWKVGFSLSPEGLDFWVLFH